MSNLNSGRTALLLDPFEDQRGVVNKDVNAGLGTRTQIRSGWAGRLIEAQKRKHVVLPTLAFAYASALLKRAGYAVAYRRAGDLSRALRAVGDVKPDLVVMHPGMVNHAREIEVARSVKAAFPDVRVGAIGPFASLYPERFAESLDWVVAGEFETRMMNEDPMEWSGIVRAGAWVGDLDTLPFPDWEPFDRSVFSYSPMIPWKPFLTMQGSRGCPMSCAKYCPYPTSQGKKWRKRSVESVLAEIERNVRDFGVRGMLFRDAYFSLNRKHTEEFAEKLLSRGLPVRWGAETRLDSLDKNLLTALHRAGLRSLNVGIESESEEVLQHAGRKGFSDTLQRDLISFCEWIGVKINAFFIVGLPADTGETLAATLQHARGLPLFTAQFTINTPLPGTGYFEDMKPNLLHLDFERYDNNHVVFRHPNLTAEQIYQAHAEAFRSFYFRPSYWGRLVRWRARDILDRFPAPSVGTGYVEQTAQP